MHKLGYLAFPPRFRAMRTLTLRAVKITKRLKERRIQVIEVHPTSTCKALRIPARNWKCIQEILQQIGHKGDIVIPLKNDWKRLQL